MNRRDMILGHWPNVSFSGEIFGRIFGGNIENFKTSLGLRYESLEKRFTCKKDISSRVQIVSFLPPKRTTLGPPDRSESVEIEWPTRAAEFL